MDVDVQESTGEASSSSVAHTTEQGKADAGKERQEAGQVADAGSASTPAAASTSTSTSVRTVPLAPVQPLPRTAYIHLEYPGVIRGGYQNRTQTEGHGNGTASTSRQPDIDTDTAGQSTTDNASPTHSSLPAHPASHPADGPLRRALVTLSPTAPPYGTVSSALDHLGRLVSLKSKAIEWRPWAADAGGHLQDDDDDGGAEAPSHPVRTGPDLYRHPIVGDLVETHDMVAVVQRRIWRRKRKGKGKDKGDATSATAAAEEAEPEFEERKEYTVDALGIAKTTARWRRMADFAYEPEISGPAGAPAPEKDLKLVDEPCASASATAAEGRRGHQGASAGSQDVEMGDAAAAADAPPKGGLLSLHDALARMDVQSLRSFKMPEEKERHEVEVQDEAEKMGVRTASNLRMIPPPIFTRADLPFPYA